METLSACKNCILFNGIAEDTIKSAITMGHLESFNDGETVIAPQKSQHGLGIVVCGRLEVYKACGASRVFMGILEASSITGAASVFLSEAIPVTEVVSYGKSVVLFIDEDNLRLIMKGSFDIAANYINYLTERIHHLTARIESIAAPTVQDKLLCYLRQRAVGEKVTLVKGYTALADALSVSRASLYRVLEDLEKDGSISRNGKEITLLF